MKKIIPILILLTLISCRPKEPGRYYFGDGEFEFEITVGARQRIDENAFHEAGQESNSMFRNLDPVEGDIIGALNDSEPGEIIDLKNMCDIVTDAIDYSNECYNAFDPALQIIWDIYEFKDGGRYVSRDELTDALRYVDISNLELTGDCRILRKNQHTRFGLGPAWSGAGYGLVSKSLIEHGISDVLLRVGQTYGVIGGNPAVNVVEINYPLEPGREDAITIPVGHVRLREGQYLSCLDDDEHYFFERGEQYHQVVDPIYGKPVRNVRMACIVSQESPLQASIFAYALMVMGPDRGIEFVNETDGVEGIIFDENYEIHVSSGLEDIFWR